MTNTIILYSKDYCPYCKRAKALLTAKGVTYTDFDIVDNPALTAEMIARSGGRRTVPQIFIGDTHVGGASDLFDLEDAGKLDALLAPVLAAA
ncbi:glutaredoxin 3 [Fretibacter rubidus]|uniref:glutaredoxin 3 n=1 Tax=Fretibacter rubidus TaxID=570162 RepID=UPI00352A1623